MTSSQDISNALWTQIHLLVEAESEIAGAPARPAEAPRGRHTPLSREKMAVAVGRNMAAAWMRKHAAPDSEAELAREIAQETPKWQERLGLAVRCMRALETMPDSQFQWRATGRQNDGDIIEPQCWPQPGQLVLYFFEVVGSHAGYFAGKEEGMDTFCNLFGGFLGGDVTHWMPMPGLEGERIRMDD